LRKPCALHSGKVRRPSRPSELGLSGRPPGRVTVSPRAAATLGERLLPVVVGPSGLISFMNFNLCYCRALLGN
jgi:hypothetical protein